MLKFIFLALVVIQGAPRLDSTLLILQLRLKADAGRPQIQVLKEYSNLPLVGCYAGQLNQVFMNLLANAIDALEQEVRESQPTPTIWIRTAVLDSERIHAIAARSTPKRRLQKPRH